jgi:hypothetical protein
MRLEVSMIEPGDGGALPPTDGLISEDILFLTEEDGSIEIHKGYYHSNGCFYACMRSSNIIAALAPDTRPIPNIPVVRAWAFVRSVRVIKED